MDKPQDTRGTLGVQTAREEGRPLLCAVRGDVDAASAPQLEYSLLEAAHRHREPRMVLDLAGVGFIDSTGVRALWRVATESRAAGGGLALHSPSRAVRRLLALAGLDREVVIGSDLEGARRSLEDESS